MPFEEALADRFRKALGKTRNTSERKMMGGLCFFVAGHMVGAVDSTEQHERRLVFRIGKPNVDEALSRRGAYQMKQGDRVMRGFVCLDADKCTDTELRQWIQLAKSFVKTLPAK